jgi:hypothetical protein
MIPPCDTSLSPNTLMKIWNEAKCWKLFFLNYKIKKMCDIIAAGRACATHKTLCEHYWVHKVALICIVQCETDNLHHSGFLENNARHSKWRKNINPFNQTGFFSGLPVFSGLGSDLGEKPDWIRKIRTGWQLSKYDHNQSTDGKITFNGVGQDNNV